MIKCLFFAFVVCVNFFAKAQTDSLAPYLNMTLEELMSLKVTTAGKQEQKVSEIPASVVVITRTDIEAYGYQSLKEILSNAFGMYKMDDYRNVSFGVRGFYTNVYNRNIVFLINGVEQKQPYQNWNDLYLMNIQVEAIERIEFVRGPAAVIYGNDAFFGVINIITNQKGGGDKSSVNTAYGMNNTYRGNMQINTSSENTTVSFSAGFFSTDGRNVPFNKMVDSLPLSNGSFIKDGTTKGYFAQQSSYFNLNVEHKGFYSSLSYDKTNRNLIHLFAPVYDNSKPIKRDFLFRAELGYRKKITPIFSYDFHVYFGRFQIMNDLSGMLVNPKLSYGINKGETQFVNMELLTYLEPLKKLKFTLGANCSLLPEAYSHVDVPAVGFDRMFVQLYSPSVSYAVFTQVEYSLTKKINILAGGRADKQEKNEFKNIKYLAGTYKDTLYYYDYEKVALIPQVAVVFKVDSKNTLKLMYSEAISRPGMFENSFLLWVPHLQLEPQLIKTAEVNYATLAANRLTCNSSLFYNRLINLITRSSISDIYTGTYNTQNNNSGEMETFGCEIEVMYKPVKALLLDGSFSFQKTKNLLFDNVAAYSPNILAYFRANYHLTNDIIFAINSYFVGSMLSEWDETPVDPIHGDFSPRGRIADKTPAYVNLGANFRYDNILKKGVYFNLHVENLLNSDVRYAPTPDNFSLLPNGTLEDGVKLNIAIGLKF